jgi:hypothetical protein
VDLPWSFQDGHPPAVLARGPSVATRRGEVKIAEYTKTASVCASQRGPPFPEPFMTQDEFWDHIRASRRVDQEEHAERLAKRLSKLPEKEIVSFVQRWEEASANAYRWDLWGAAYLINGGCSDDGFQYFRWWLLLQGRAVYEAAIANPDSLAEVVDSEEEVEAEVYPGTDAWFLATGKKQDDAGYAAFNQAVGRKNREPDKPKGKQWDFDDDKQLQRRLPKLTKMYLGEGEDD